MSSVRWLLPGNRTVCSVLQVLAFMVLFAGCRSPALSPSNSTAAASALPDSSPPAPTDQPRFDRIDYAHPERYTALLPSFGKAETLRAIAAQVGGASSEDKLRNLSAWIKAHLRYDASAAYEWRDVDRMLAAGTYGGCADLSLAFGAIARAMGLPTVWVKTMDADWIREFREREGNVETWRGHVFLEIFYDGHWVLVDPGPAVVQRDYDPRARILPGDRYAYDKGDDPYEMLLSTRWDEWRRQTRTYFDSFDPVVLPVPEGSSLFMGGIYVVADGPVYRWLDARCEELGFSVDKSFNTDFDRLLPPSRGHTLILTVVGRHSVLPDRYWAEYAPSTPEEVQRAMEAHPSGRLDRTLADGTKVVLLFGRDLDSVRAEVDKLTLGSDAGVR